MASTIRSTKGKLVVSGVHIHDTHVTGINAASAVSVTSVSVTGNRFGAADPEYSFAIQSAHLSATDSTVSNNAGFGVYSTSLTGEGLTARGNGNAGVLVVGRTLQLARSVVTGNNGFAAGVDIVSKTRPHLIETTCGLSAKSLAESDTPGAPWGVCAHDPHW